MQIQRFTMQGVRSITAAVEKLHVHMIQTGVVSTPTDVATVLVSVLLL